MQKVGNLGTLFPDFFEEKPGYFSEIEEFYTVCQKMFFYIETIRFK